MQLPVAGVASTPGCGTVLARSVVVMVTRQEAVTRQERLCPESTHAVLTAGEQNVTHGASVMREEGKVMRKRFRVQSGRHRICR